MTTIARIAVSPIASHEVKASVIANVTPSPWPSANDIAKAMLTDAVAAFEVPFTSVRCDGAWVLTFEGR